MAIPAPLGSAKTSAFRASEVCPLNCADRPLLQEFREVLGAANYTDEGIRSLLGGIEFPSLRERNLPRLLHDTAGGSARETLIRLFLLGVQVEKKTAAHALRPLTAEHLVGLGVLESGDGEVRATVSLVPWEGLLLVFDQPQKIEQGTAAADHVIWPTNSTIELSRMAIHRQATTVLDLGAGCGVQAMMSAPHSDIVYATDCNARAGNFALFSTRLNGLENVISLVGDSFEPVRGLRFDLILSNPPFILSPKARFVYRDSGREGDAFCRELIRQAPHFLEKGGFCQLIFEWMETAGQDWQAVLSPWFSGTGCDVWVLRLGSQSPSLYANHSISSTEQDSPEVTTRLYQEWMDYYREKQVAAIGSGLATMRRCGNSSPFLRFDEAPQDRSQAYGAAVERIFAQQDFLRSVPSDDLLFKQVLRPAPDLRLVEEHTAHSRGWRRTGMELAMGGSNLRYSYELAPDVATLVAHCDGKRTLRQALRRVAAQTGLTEKRLAARCLPAVRELISYGFLAPARLAQPRPHQVHRRA